MSTAETQTYRTRLRRIREEARSREDVNLDDDVLPDYDELTTPEQLAAHLASLVLTEDELNELGRLRGIEAEARERERQERIQQILIDPKSITYSEWSEIALEDRLDPQPFKMGYPPLPDLPTVTREVPTGFEVTDFKPTDVPTEPAPYVSPWKITVSEDRPDWLKKLPIETPPWNPNSDPNEMAAYPEFFGGNSLLGETIDPYKQYAPFHPMIHDKSDDSPEITANWSNWQYSKKAYELMASGGVIHTDPREHAKYLLHGGGGRTRSNNTNYSGTTISRMRFPLNKRRIN